MIERETIDALESRLNKIGTIVTRLAAKMFMKHLSASASLAVSGD
jgi:hypothetical protein